MTYCCVRNRNYISLRFDLIRFDRTFILNKYVGIKIKNLYRFCLYYYPSDQSTPLINRRNSIQYGKSVSMTTKLERRKKRREEKKVDAVLPDLRSSSISSIDATMLSNGEAGEPKKYFYVNNNWFEQASIMRININTMTKFINNAVVEM